MCETHFVFRVAAWLETQEQYYDVYCPVCGEPTGIQTILPHFELSKILEPLIKENKVVIENGRMATKEILITKGHIENFWKGSKPKSEKIEYNKQVKAILKFAKNVGLDEKRMESLATVLSWKHLSSEQK